MGLRRWASFFEEPCRPRLDTLNARSPERLEPQVSVRGYALRTSGTIPDSPARGCRLDATGPAWRILARIIHEHFVARPPSVEQMRVDAGSRPAGGLDSPSRAEDPEYARRCRRSAAAVEGFVNSAGQVAGQRLGRSVGGTGSCRSATAPRSRSSALRRAAHELGRRFSGRGEPRSFACAGSRSKGWSVGAPSPTRRSVAGGRRRVRAPAAARPDRRKTAFARLGRLTRCVGAHAKRRRGGAR